MYKFFAILALSFALAQAGVLPAEPVKILFNESYVNPDGTFHNKFETENGINYQEDGLQTASRLASDGAPAAVSQGAVSYTSPDGTPVQLTWVADENGFQPQGAHLPVAPEVPPQIIRALEYIAAHPYVEPQHQRK